MSLITCCPACQTMFKVSGEDLRVSDGWVRCGKCDGVFDASAHLQMAPPAPAQGDAQAEAWESEASMAPVAAPPPARPPSPPSMSFPVDERSSLLRAETSAEAQAPVAVFTSAEEAPATEPDVSHPAALRREDRSGRASLVPEPVSFFSHPSRRSPWRVVFWLLAAAALCAALIGGVRHERQTLVQRVPAMLPLLDGLCLFTACDMLAPRLLEAVAIEGASMEEVGPSEYKVQLLLKNVGEVAVSLPALNVTLTGLQGEVLVRQVALPAQFAPGIVRLQTGTPLSVVLTLKAAVLAQPAESLAALPTGAPTPTEVAALGLPAVAPAPAEAVASPALAISGYRVIAFYP